MIKIHAIQTGTVLVKTAFLSSPAKRGVLPYMANLFIDQTRLEIPIMAWAIEHAEGVIIVDTGEHSANKGTFAVQARYNIIPEQEIGAQLTRLGLASKVSKVVLTHLHGDHMDGIKDFRNTPIWVSQREYAPFQQSKGSFLGKLGIQLPDWFQPNTITFRDEPRGPFAQSYPLTADGTIFAIPTPGHTAGHMSVVVVDEGIHYFIAGDVTYKESCLLTQKLEGPSLEVALHRDTLKRSLAYTQQYPTVFLPSHDPESARRLAAKQIVPMKAAQVA